MYKELQKISLTGTGARMYERQCTLQGGWRLFAASVKAAQFRQPPFRVLPTGSKQGARAALLSQSSTAPQPTGRPRRNQSGSAGDYAPAPTGVRPSRHSAPPCAYLAGAHGLL